MRLKSSEFEARVTSEDGATTVIDLLHHRRRRQLAGVRLVVITVQIDAVNSNTTYCTALQQRRPANTE